MLSELKKKEILLIKGILDDYKKGIEDANSALEVIDEKYKKIIAEEKKSLKANLAEYKTQVKVYEKMFSAFDTTAVKEALGDYQVTSTEEPEKVEETTPTVEEEGTVFDSIYPENNKEDEAQSISESVELAEVAAVADAVPADSVSATAELAGDWPAAPEEEVVPVEESAEVVFPEEKEVPVLEIGENDWPDFPEDWK